jgi:hypothetical protein
VTTYRGIVLTAAWIRFRVVAVIDSFSIIQDQIPGGIRMNLFRMVAVFTLVLFLISITTPALADATDLLSYTHTTPYDGTYFEHTTPLSSIKSATQSNPKASLDMGSLAMLLFKS